MTSQNAVLKEAPSYEPPATIDADTVTVETRFGSIEFQLRNAVRMPRGMLGYADFHSYGLANLPDPKLDQFKLFQCLEEPTLSFIVAPLSPNNDTIDTADLAAACEALSIDPANAVTLLVVSTRPMGQTTQISVNMRAPVILDGENQVAYQHVLMNNRYPVRQVIGTGQKSAD